MSALIIKANKTNPPKMKRKKSASQDRFSPSHEAQAKPTLYRGFAGSILEIRKKVMLPSLFRGSS
jgi:hypothetical protein